MAAPNAPLGATLDKDGANFAIFSAHAERVELCLFDQDGLKESARINLARSGDLWHGHIDAIRAGAQGCIKAPVDPATLLPMLSQVHLLAPN